MRAALTLIAAVLGVLFVSMAISVGVHYSDWREHGKWCQAHSHEMPAKRAPGDVQGPTWMPEGCP